MELKNGKFDAADYSEWKNNRRSMSLFFSAGTVALKFGSGFAGTITSWILSITCYLPDATQNTRAFPG